MILGNTIKTIASKAISTRASDQFDTEEPPLLQATGLVREYALPRERLWSPPPTVRALDGVSLSIAPGRSLGVVGESGSGKSTLARLVMALDAPTSGSVHLLGRDLHTLPAAELRAARRDFQMVFQDPYGSLDPRQTVARIVAEPLQALHATPDAAKVSRAEQRERAGEALAQVGLRTSDLDKYPHEFSGGQRQRIAIARAIVTRPRLVVADEPVSALDVSVQAQVLNLLQDLQETFGITYLLISHDLAVVNHLCDEVVVLYQGRIVERGTPEALFSEAEHPYTRALVAAVPPIAPRPARAAAVPLRADGQRV
ncbi:ATP-binding cassette domain-containing protein [Acidovorax sp. SUPP3334]|uniref:ATP-binding cassette domain-containing protein n=1 Tax=Acidovorax sp. SUPP3334 TaxID=2920881 RepID=UPI0023DE25E3|nr:ATP-binding cassette domain-containing protein [Acidovorax sp. SUPP3334]GKT20397.1 ATP-binding cassette domain-containing protein [Acidovorax sp. SUPP3334]